MKAVFVCGPWGSGTSAVAGVLTNLGCVSIKPLFVTNDPKTRDSYESMAFRSLLLQLGSEPNVSLYDDAKEKIIPSLVAFRNTVADQFLRDNVRKTNGPIMLKHALSSLIIPELAEVFDAKFVFVMRDIAKIEESRLRRSWPSHCGAEGAKKIYSSIAMATSSTSMAALTVQYEELIADPIAESKRLADFCELNLNRDELKKRVKVVAKHPNSNGSISGVSRILRLFR